MGFRKPNKVEKDNLNKNWTFNRKNWTKFV